MGKRFLAAGKEPIGHESHNIVIMLRAGAIVYGSCNSISQDPFPAKRTLDPCFHSPIKGNPFKIIVYKNPT
jgi:hypothetical protein